MSEALTSQGEVFQFDEFELDVAGFELRCEGEPIALEPQVFGLLSYLVQNRERLVSKDELLDELWGHRFVSESALATQIKSLRKAVGDDGRSQRVIKTIHGRGYRFVAELKQMAAVAHESEPIVSVVEAPQHNLPRERSPLFGRREDLESLASILQQHRLVSILGIGGTGKTRLSVALGRMLLENFPDGVWFVDLIPASQGSAIDDAIANVTRLALNDGDARRQVVESFRDRRMLVILDNCEHIKEDVAEAIDFFLDHTDEPRFLLTSRDPVNLVDERRYFLEPLKTESDGDVSPAAQLFVSTAERHGVSQLSINLELIDQVCRQLDGLPLAIELAAAQLQHLSLEELANRLNRRFQVLTGRQRTASVRQSNLAAVLEDTWKMLGEAERELLGQLAAFPSQFTMDDVEDLVGEQFLEKLPVAMSRLVELSLLNRGQGNWWRLLETVREFTRANQDGEVTRRYAEIHADWCKRKLGEYPGDHLDNLSQALWCLEHYDDLEAAENFLEAEGRLEDAMFLCCSTGLMIQLDDGARSRHRLERAKHYLAMGQDKYWQAKLHAMAGLCGQGIRSPELLLSHTAEYRKLAAGLKDDVLLANALIMASLTEVFTDGDNALSLIDEAIELARRGGSDSSALSATCFRAWHLGVLKRYEEAIAEAETLFAEAKEQKEADNPAYNSVATIVTCSVLDEPAKAMEWAACFTEFPAASEFWVIQLLRACVFAANDMPADGAKLCVGVRSKLRQASKDEFPDLVIPAAVLAHNRGDDAKAIRWLTAVRNSKRTIQTYHLIIIYRQLYAKLGFDDSSDVDIDTARREINEYIDLAAM